MRFEPLFAAIYAISLILFSLCLRFVLFSASVGFEDRPRRLDQLFPRVHQHYCGVQPRRRLS